MTDTSHMIALLDCDSFFASCAMVEDPNLQNRAVCVVSKLNNRGIVLARSKLAKEAGIKMCDPFFKIKDSHPQVAFVPANMDLYQEISHEIMAILREFAPVVEVASIDEAYMDLTGLDRIRHTTYHNMMTHLRAYIQKWVGVPVSIGVSTSKTLAKLASEQAKKSNGIYMLDPTYLPDVIQNLPISEVGGVGQKNTQKLAKNGIFTINDFINTPDSHLKQIMGINGPFIKMELKGMAASPVNGAPTLPQSISHSYAFDDFSDDKAFLLNQLYYHLQQVCRKLRAHGGVCADFSLMLKKKDFSTQVLTQKLPTPSDDEADFKQFIPDLLDKIYHPNTLYRSCGIEFHHILYESSKQSDLFTAPAPKNPLNDAITQLENKFGNNIIKKGWI